MNSTNEPAILLTHNPYVAEQSQGGWHYNAAQLYDTVMMEPRADQIPSQTCSTECLQSVPSWLPYWGQHHGGQTSQWFHNSQGMVYQPGYPYYGYQETRHQVVNSASFHYPQPNCAPVQGIGGVPTVSSFVEVPPYVNYPQISYSVAVLPTPGFLRSQDLQESPAATHFSGLDLMCDLSNKPQVPIHPNPGLQSFGDGLALQDPKFPQVTSLEDAMMFFQCEPKAEIPAPSVQLELGDGSASTEPMIFVRCEPQAEISEISQPPVEPEFGKANADTGSIRVQPLVTKDHSSDHMDLMVESCDGSVSAIKVAPTMDSYYDLGNFSQLCLTNPNFQDLDNWSGLVDPKLPEVTFLEDTTRFFYCGSQAEISEIHHPPSEPELGEAKADTGPIRVDPTVTEFHFSDHADLVACTEHFLERAEFCDGPVSTTEAAPTMDSFYDVNNYGHLCLANPNLQDLNNESGLLEPRCPELTSMEYNMGLFHCKPEAKISENYQPPVELEFGEANADTGSMRVHPLATKYHSSDRMDLVACTEHFLERAEFYNGPVSAIEATSTMDSFYDVDNYGQLSLTNPNFQNLHNWSDLTDPELPEVTSQEDTMRFFQCQPEISQPPVEPELGEANADTGSMRVRPLVTKYHSSDRMDLVARTEHFLEFRDGNVSTIKASPTMDSFYDVDNYGALCLTNPNFQNLQNWSDLADPELPEVTSLEDTTRFFQCEPQISQPPVESELGEANAHTDSIRVHPTVTQDYPLDHVALETCIQFCDGRTVP